MIIIPKWKFKTIENALRLTHRINNCSTKETAFDREVVEAYDYAKCALAEPSNENSGLNIPVIIESEAAVCQHLCKQKGKDGRLYCKCGKSFVMA